MNQKSIKIIQQKHQAMFSYLNERSSRIWAATEALAYGRGGITAVCLATGISNKTVIRGIKELKKPDLLEANRIRNKGGGRKKLSFSNKNLLASLNSLIEPSTRGDPENPLLWTCKSVRNISKELNKKGIIVSYRTIGTMLKNLNYSLQGNKKTLEGRSHMDRDAQFHYINDSVKEMHKKGQPTISVDTKKKENLGKFKNVGKLLCKNKEPIKVNSHDFPDKNLGKVVPYGVYDIGKNKGWVSVGISADTAEFSVNTIRAWWYHMGSKEYKKAKELLITADCGGSNGYRARLWKKELQKFANETNLNIHVRHFPPATSKWNKIEHKMFCYISQNWRGRPLVSRETVVNLIGSTRTDKGLEIQAMLDNNQYKTGKKVSNKEMIKLSIEGSSFHPEWNYIIKSQARVDIV